MTEFSYLSAPRTTPYIYRTVIDVFNETSKAYPDKEILIYRGIDGTREILTYRQLQTEATKFARYLVTKGTKKGDKIALFGPNTLEWVVAELAIIMAGGVVVHVTLSITDVRDLWEIFSIAECKAFLIDPGKGEKYLDMIFQLIALFRRRRPSRDYKDIDSNDPTLVFLRKSEHLASYEDLPGVLQMKEEQVEFPSLFPEDEIMIFTTSGSTGKPKMVSHTHFDVNNVELGPERPKDIILAGKTYNDRPFAWGAGSPILAVCKGETRVFCDSSIAIEGSSAMKIWEIIKEEKCTSALLMPYFLADLVAQKENYKDLFKLQAIITTGQPIDNHHTHVIGAFTKLLILGYGSTECSMISILPPITSVGKILYGDVGKPIPGTEVKVVDENGNVLRKGETGELCIRSRYLFNGYYRNKDLNGEAFLSGKWFRSGDTGHVNEENHIVIEGRIKDVISRGTRKIMPCTIEEIIMQMNGIKRVAVVGVPDKRLYEEICVCYVTEPGNDISPSNVKQYCKENFGVYESLDGLGEMPAYFLRFCKLPMFEVGKINKRRVRSDAIQQLKTQGLM
ncbi:medium-chain acyl-CoA ligase ACSF2, mitochondrial-like [Saccostrea echinata]|uniref:medium-chain acyl-CoA ligase ACSF2, mitochondrial-like n=1 Tax=Saccostrea echinata TaxID=191078 RepID=UPI002A8409F3|nr:medium-chain acyl-CoA ligase ACSF2, mitochondrial-like [Saccostrea echinata]